MASHLSGICSGATRAMLTELAAAFEGEGLGAITFEAVGGVIAAKRVRAGEHFDVVVLASGVIDALEAEGFVVPGMSVGIGLSSVAAAVPQGQSLPDLGDEDSLRQATLRASRIAYSTGPSGDQLQRLWQRWGVTNALAGRLVQAPAGVPVASLVADRTADLGFQQLSELLGFPGIEVAGRLPHGLGMETVFSGGVGAASQQSELVRHFLTFSTSAHASEIKQRFGMEPA